MNDPEKASEQDHITRKEFLLQFFGPFKRYLGNPERFLTDNPNDILEFIENCAKNKLKSFHKRPTGKGKSKASWNRKSVF